MKPLIGITMGDPAGVGPELIVKLLKNKSFDFSKFIFFGSSKVLDYEFRKYNVRIPIKNFSTIGSVDTSKEFIVNFEPKKFDFNFEIGKINPNCGKLAYEAILNAIEFANRGLIKAIVTGPINKESLKLASVDLIGHTEILSKKSKSNDVFMLMVNDELKVILCTIHVPLLKAVLSLDEKLILKTIIAANKACYNFGIKIQGLVLLD